MNNDFAVNNISENEALELFAGRRFNSYAAHFRRLFDERVQKVAINAGLSCPNRDGTKGVGGCTFCDNAAFTPSYCAPSLSVRRQIEEGIAFHRTRYRRASRFLAYFQSFSNTYAPLERLRELYAEALSHPDVMGLIVGTRPDCVDERRLDYLAELAQHRYVAVEFGVESCYDETLRRVNRCDSFETARRAIEGSAQRGIKCGAHFILGLPGESEKMILDGVERINELPLTTVKFHQLQLFKGSAMAAEYEADPSQFRFWEGAAEYVEFFVKVLERLRPTLVVERFASEAPPRFHHCTPSWGLVRNETLLNMLDRELLRQGSYQGKKYCRRDE